MKGLNIIRFTADSFHLTRPLSHRGPLFRAKLIILGTLVQVMLVGVGCSPSGSNWAGDSDWQIGGARADGRFALAFEISAMRGDRPWTAWLLDVDQRSASKLKLTERALFLESMSPFQWSPSGTFFAGSFKKSLDTGTLPLVGVWKFDEAHRAATQVWSGPATGWAWAPDKDFLLVEREDFEHGAVGLSIFDPRSARWLPVDVDTPPGTLNRGMWGPDARTIVLPASAQGPQKSRRPHEFIGHDSQHWKPVSGQRWSAKNMPALDNWDWGVVLPDRSILISELGGNDANLSLVHLPKGSATVSKQVFLSAFLLQLPVVAPNGRFLALADFPVEERGGRVVVLDTKSWKVVFECSGESVTWLSKEELLIGRDADSTIYSGQNSLSKKGIWRVEFKSGRVEHIWPRGN